MVLVMGAMRGNVIDAQKVNELSTHLLEKFKAKSNCVTCYGFGIVSFQKTANGNYFYRPCRCVGAK